jgi:hypothetical protein
VFTASFACVFFDALQIEFVNCNQSVVLLSRQPVKMPAIVFAVVRHVTSGAILFAPCIVPWGTPIKMLKIIHDQ